MTHRTLLKNQRGNTIVIVMMILVLITVIGISSMNDSLVEVRVATNDLLYKRSFFLTDGGFELVAELLEKNIGNPIGFPKVSSTDPGVVWGGTNPFAVMVLDPNYGRPCMGVAKNPIDFWQNELEDICPYPSLCEKAPGRPSCSNMDMYFPADVNGDGGADLADVDEVTDCSTTNAVPHTRIRLSGKTFFSEGAALSQEEGYAGGGKSGGAGGTHRLYNIYVQTFGERENDALMMAQYRHMIGQE